MPSRYCIFIIVIFAEGVANADGVANSDDVANCADVALFVYFTDGIDAAYVIDCVDVVNVVLVANSTNVFKCAIPGLFLIYFWPFQTNIKILLQRNVQNVHPVSGAGI